MDVPEGIYLDHNATTPVHPAVVDAMVPYFTKGFGNPSSIHRHGVYARYAIETARENVAAALGVDGTDVVFTGGGTEANNLCVRGAFFASKIKNPHIVCSVIEHSSVRRTVEELEKLRGARVTWVGSLPSGEVDADAMIDAIGADTALVCLMAANNETGIVQPVEKVAAACAEKRVVFHSDCVQLFGKAPLPEALRAPHVTLSISAHKFYGPKGVGAVVVPVGMVFRPLIHGGGQERELRSGTENTPAIVGMGHAVTLQSDRKAADRLRVMRDELWGIIHAGVPDVVQSGDPDLCLPGTLSLSLPHVKGPDVVRQLDRQGVFISAGSACSSGRRELSPVIKALGLDETIPWGAIRISLGHRNTEEDVRTAGAAVVDVVQRLRAGAA